jgi:dsRNA-specific ribonuclease
VTNEQGMKTDYEAITREREEAWVGDAVLALYVREWILREHGGLDGARFVRFTSNDFLRALGNPTSVEAEIGVIYQEKGLEAACAHIEEKLLPVFLQQEKVRERQIRGGKLKG